MGNPKRRSDLTYRILALSDLHLGEAHTDERYPLFLQVLKAFNESDIQELLLMGDIFDILIGNKKFWKNIHPDFFKELETAQNNHKKITWVQGNHDFQLKGLLEPLGVHWISDHEVLQRESAKISVSHGDLADKSNKLHPIWRGFLNSKAMAALIFLIPEKLGQDKIYPLTLKLSKASRRVSNSIDESKLRNAVETFRTHAKNLGDKHKADLVILGHSHISDEVQITPTASYLNLGSWLSDPQVALVEIENKKLSVKVYAVSSWLANTSKQ